MVDLVDTPTVAPPEPPGSRRWGWKAWTVFGTVIAVLAAGAVTATLLARHYRYASPLECVCGFGWYHTGHEPIHDSQAGPWSASAVTANPAVRQSFVISIVNRSSVTQTVLGIAPGQPTGYHIQLAMAPGEDLPARSYTRRPLTLAPGGVGSLEFSFRSWCIARRASIYWTDVPARVRVGAFTREEDIPIDDGEFAVAVHGTKASAHYGC